MLFDKMHLSLLLAFQTSIIHVVWSLELKRVVIPEYAILGKSALLECDFTLHRASGGEGTVESLYALKWYKDSHEFFRFKPSDQAPHITVFPLEGVHVDIGGSSLHRLRLERVMMASRGVYRCEISAEAPSFQTLGEDQLLRVIALPEKGPTISGLHPWTNVGQHLSLTCHVHNAFPSPSISWIVNHHPVDGSSCGGCLSGESYEEGEKKGDDGTIFYSTTSHLSLDVELDLVRDGTLAVECRSTFPQSNVTLRHALHSNIKAGLGGLAHYAHTGTNKAPNKAPNSFYSFSSSYVLLLNYWVWLIV